MFALHPGRQISPVATPELAAAARITLDTRVSQRLSFRNLSLRPVVAGFIGGFTE
jgi:hypothetical protein